ncbi:rod shape-determining protein MreD [Patescibacteria group bacterium]|nr:rod shape-determining protein MreD [Patescibacteria group bacterium]
MIKRIITIILVVLILVIQISFLSNFEFWRPKLNLIIILLTFLLLTAGYQQALIWGLISGYLLDYYSAWPFGLITFSLITSIFIVYLIGQHYLTNRSLTTFVLLVGAFTLSFYLFLIIGHFLLSLFALGNLSSLASLAVSGLWQILFNCLIGLVSFLIYTFATNRFQRNFLVKGNL